MMPKSGAAGAAAAGSYAWNMMQGGQPGAPQIIMMQPGGMPGAAPSPMVVPPGLPMPGMPYPAVPGMPYPSPAYPMCHYSQSAFPQVSGGSLQVNGVEGQTTPMGQSAQLAAAANQGAPSHGGTDTTCSQALLSQNTALLASTLGVYPQVGAALQQAGAGSAPPSSQGGLSSQMLSNQLTGQVLTGQQDSLANQALLRTAPLSGVIRAGGAMAGAQMGARPCGPRAAMFTHPALQQAGQPALAVSILGGANSNGQSLTEDAANGAADPAALFASAAAAAAATGFGTHLSAMVGAGAGVHGGFETAASGMDPASRVAVEADAEPPAPHLSV